MMLALYALNLQVNSSGSFENKQGQLFFNTTSATTGQHSCQRAPWSKKSGLLGGCVLVLLISGMGCANAQYNARSANGAAATVAMEETEECGEAGVEISPKTNRITIRPGEEPQVDILAALSING